MSLIESLRSEVKEKESEHAAQMAEREAQQAYYEQNLKPPMLQTLDYFSEVVANLKFLNTKTPVTLPLSPDGTSPVPMEQAGYEFFYDDAKNPLRLDIVCECQLTAAQRFHVSSPKGVSHYTDFLDKMQFAYHRKTELDRQYDIRSAIFELEGPVKVGVKIQASPVDRCIYIDLHNLEDMPHKRYKFSPGSIDLELLERLARLILRQEETLVNVELPPEIRNDLSKQVEALQKQRDTELKQAMEDMRLAQEAEMEARKLSTRIRKWTEVFRASLTRNP